MLLGLAVLALTVATDLALGSETVVGAFAVAPLVAAIAGGPRATVVVASAAAVAGAASGLWNGNLGGADWVACLSIIVAAGLFALLAARVRAKAQEGTARLRLLDRVGRIADGALPLPETLERVTEAVVPAFADLCMIDAIRDRDVRRIAAKASGDEAARIEDHIRNRTPSTPDWLRDPSSGSMAPHFVPRMPDRVLREMANDPEDLAFLRWLRANSYVVAPLVSRGRSLGTLTVVRRGRSAPLAGDEVDFVAALASRVGIALDNAGLFSDLRSIERRMDSVMENVSEAVMVHDGSGKLVYANPAASVLRDPRLQVHDEDGRPLDPSELPRSRSLRGEEPSHMVFRLHDRESGEESWRLEKSTSIRGPAGEVLYAVTTVQDITALKQAEFDQRLLADTAEALASATDYVSALQALARAVVPQLADWCSVNVPTPDGGFEQLAVSDDDRKMLELNRRLREGLQARSGRWVAMADVLRTTNPVTAELPPAPAPGWVLLKPIRAGGGAIGILCLVKRPGRRAFTPHEIGLARAVADRAGVAILNAKLATERAEIAETLQRELLPPLLPEVAGWTLAAMYRPAGEQNRAGGDFYDVFEGEDGWVVVVGDVEGHGAEAAALTAMVRYTIRTAATLGGGLLAALDILSAELHNRERPLRCSVACVTFGTGPEATVVAAGHPLPLLVSEEGIREVGLPGSLLGALEEPDWSPVRFTVSRGEKLVIYTDGIVEARRSKERFGRERLRSLLDRVADPAEIVRRVGTAIDDFAETIQDDAAFVVMRRESGAEEPAPMAATLPTEAPDAK
jgi:GAF domain-containing protein